MSLKLSVVNNDTVIRGLGENISLVEETIRNIIQYKGISMPDVPLVDLERNITEIEKEKFAHQTSFLEINKEKAIKHINKYFPKNFDTDIQHQLEVIFLPYGLINYGPTPGMQLFSLYPEANPIETYLFYVHIYYHEIAFLNYTNK